MSPRSENGVVDALRAMRVVPVVSLPSAAAGVDLARLLSECGLPVVEITCRTPHAVEGIRAIRRHCPEVLVLAGTVLDPDQAELVLDAGAAAIVSPGFSPRLAGWCDGRGAPFIPGVVTPSEVQSAREAGLTTLKFFPAERGGGVKMLATYRQLYQDIRFMPTGGINQDNLRAYLGCANVVCCGGTWLAPEQFLRDGRWTDIRDRVAAAVEAS